MQPSRDGFVAGGLFAQEGVELARRDVVEAVALDVVADDDGIIDAVVDILAGDVELALEVEVGEAARADSDPGPVELFDMAHGAAPADEEALRSGVIGLRERKVLHAAAHDSDRRERDVPSVSPV